MRLIGGNMIKINEIKRIIVEHEGYKYKGSIADVAYDYDCYENGPTELQILKDDGDIKDCSSDSFTVAAIVTVKDNPNESIIVSKQANDDSKLFICSSSFNFSLVIDDDRKISIVTPNKEKYTYFPEDKYGVYYKVIKLLDGGMVLDLGSGIRIDDNTDIFIDWIHNMILEGLNEAKISVHDFEELFEVFKIILIICIIDCLKKRLKELQAMLETESDECVQEITELVNSISTNIKNAQQKLVDGTQKA